MKIVAKSIVKTSNSFNFFRYVIEFRKKDDNMKKVLTIILDGFGWSDNALGNAVKMAPPTNFLDLWNKYPHSLLQASGEYVGLEDGQFGNSEVGHMTIGAGRKILQSPSLIREFLTSKTDTNANFQDMIQKAKEGHTLHVMGLLSDGGVHSSLYHYMELIEILKKNDIHNVAFHVISDGRDTDTHSTYTYISQLQDKLKETDVGFVASICGRYYAMDRDTNWQRTKKYYELVVHGAGYPAPNIPFMIQKCYEKDLTDEFLPPIRTKEFVPIKGNDCLLWMNYRMDRTKQIIRTFVEPNFQEFEVTPMPELSVYSFLPIDTKIKTKYFLNREEIKNPLGIYFSDLGMTQARIAETEKYAHVTYFFDGEKELNLPGCQKYLIPSPKVATYDLKPEMSAVEITKRCIACMEKDVDFIFMNYANPDMVGHTGNLEATIKACVTVDMCVKVLAEKAKDNFYTMVILADHGNADQMLDEKGNPVTTHTTSKVPFIITDNKIKLAPEGDLTNVAPTILEYMDIALPPEMRQTKSLIVK